MKSFGKLILLIMMTIFVFFTFVENTKSQPRSTVNFQFFYDQLSPYGRWISNPRFGYVWHPNVASDFHPYRTNGHWIWTIEYEWLWVSDYEWGWAPFHYGRWYYDELYGWLWIPANEWSPAWVVWRSGVDFYGWAPLSPGVEISIIYSSEQYYFPNNYWSFVPQYYVTSYTVYNHCYHAQRNQTFLQFSKYVLGRKRQEDDDRQFYLTGPDKREIEERTRQKVVQYNISNSDKPGPFLMKENHIDIYKPMVEMNDKEIARPLFISPDENQINSNKKENKDVPNNQQKNKIIPKKDFDQPIQRNQEKQKEKLPENNLNQNPVNKKLPPGKNELPRRTPDKWEPIHTIPDKPIAPPINKRPINFSKPSSNQLKKVPVNKEVIKRVP